MNRSGPMTLMLALCVFSCSEGRDKEDKTHDDGSMSPIVATESSKKVEVDASSRTEWIGFDLDSASYISAADLPNNSGWDLSFKRTSIKMHDSEVQMQIVGQDYANIELAPKDGYLIDQHSTEIGTVETSGLAFHAEPAWYTYDVNTHVVSSRGLSYIIKSNDGRHFKLKFLDYYNAARLPAYINFEFQEVKMVQP